MNRRGVILVADRSVTAARLGARLGARRGTWSLEADCTVAIEVPSATLGGAVSAEWARPIVYAVENVGARDLPADLIIPATWSFVCKLDPSAWPQRRFNAATAAYQLEEYLPVPLEEVTCAFVHRRHGPCWGVAVLTDPLKCLLDALQDERVAIERVGVDVFAALAAAPTSPEGCVWVVVRDHHHVGLALRDDGGGLPRAVRTTVLPDGGGVFTPGVMRAQLLPAESGLDHHAGTWAVCDLRSGHDYGPANRADADRLGDDESADAGDVPSAPGPEDEEERSPSESITSVTLDRADLMRSMVEHPDQLDLRTGALTAPSRLAGAVRQARRCAVLALALLGVVAIDARLQLAHCREEIGEVRSRQAEQFSAAFPGKSVPHNPAMRLASERIRLEGLTRRSTAPGEGVAVQVTGYALLDDLRRLTAGLPADVRIRLTELKIDARQLTLRGHTADHRDAERIVETVSNIPTLTARPARTSRLQAGGVEFAIRATRSRDDQDSDNRTSPRLGEIASAQ
ncbi:MAG: hypothetical protein GY842_01710 [bacterium]|nr:hypothetical protein [bacterium]